MLEIMIFPAISDFMISVAFHGVFISDLFKCFLE